MAPRRPAPAVVPNLRPHCPAGAAAMATPAHHLRRLRLQVHSADQASAQALRSQFEAGLSRRLADVVAAVCDELGPEEELLRIDRLDLALGAFALEELEREAPLALERALREALLQALAAARHNPAPGQRLLAPAEARLDRLATFLRLGLVPHRVASEPFAPADDLLALHHQPRAGRRRHAAAAPG